jgi:hypothetical protein
MAVLIGSIFWQIPETTEGIKGRVSALFFTCTFMVMSSFAALPVCACLKFLNVLFNFGNI